MDFAASAGGTHKGQQTDYTSIHGYIRLRKPQMLRVLGYLPVVRLRSFALASDGHTFTLLIPPRSRAIQGSNTVTTKTTNPLENLRPDVFLDSILIRRISPDWIVSLTNSSLTKVDLRTSSSWLRPRFMTSTIAEVPGERSPSAGLPQVGQPLRVIHFSRINLMPAEQDIYDARG